jgi:hypothetical protein
MKGKAQAQAAAGRPALARDPLSAEDILSGFYLPHPAQPSLAPVPPSVTPQHGQSIADRPAAPVAPSANLQKKPKPVHYKIVCISLYVEDIERLDTLVSELKRRGHTKANKSQVIRAALEQIDLDKVPKAH